MNPAALSPVPILVVGDEEVFASFLQHFPATTYLILFASGAAEAMVLCESNSPRLMVVPLDAQGADLATALRAVDHAGGKILGVTGSDPPATNPEATDRMVSSEDAEAFLAAASELLQERRQHPRVVVEFPVWFGANQQGLARDLSSHSLVIETTERLQSGEPLDLELHWGDEPRKIATTVERVKPLDLGHYSIQLVVREEDHGARAYLSEVIRKILEVEHYLHALQPGRLAVRGRAAWNLARRAEESLQRTSELGLSHEEDAEAAPGLEATLAAPAGSLWTRYHVGASLGRWGVGEVHEAQHRLLRRNLLVKQLLSDLRQDPSARARMEAEATAASAVRGDCIADVLDFGDDGEGGLFYAMEELKGETLAATMSSRAPFSVMDVTRLGVHLAFALTVAHRQGVCHWDLCPEHVFLHEVEGGLSKPKLLALAGPPDARAEPPPHPLGIAFRPPGEAGEKPSPEWDIFALCRVLGRIQAADGASGHGERLRALLTRGTSSDATRRFESMSQCCRALYQILQDLEKAPGAGPGARIVPAVLPAEGNLFRMSSTGLPIPRDVPAKKPWPRDAADIASGALDEPPGPSEKPGGRAPTLPPASRHPKAQSLKKTLYGVPTATTPQATPAREAAGSAAPAAAPAPKGSVAPAAAPAPKGSVAPAAAPAPKGSAAPAAAPAPKDSAAPAGSAVPADAPVPASSAASLVPQASGEPARLPDLAVELETRAPVPDEEEFELVTTNVVQVDPSSPKQKKTLFGLAAIPPKPLEGGADPPVSATKPLSAQPNRAVASPAANRSQAAGKSAPAKTMALASATSSREKASSAPTVLAPTTAPSPADLIASTIAEDLQAAGASGAEGAVADGQEPLQVDVPVASSLGAASATSIPSQAASPRRRRLLLIMAIGLLVLCAAGAGFYFGIFADRSGGNPQKKDDSLARGPGPARSSGKVGAISQGRVGPARGDAGVPARGTPAGEDPRTDMRRPTADGAGNAMDADPRDGDSMDSHETNPELPMDEPRMGAGSGSRENEKLLLKQRLETRLALINRGRALMRHGHNAEARKFLTEALHMWDSQRLRELFAQSHSAVGDIWPAIHHQRRAVAFSPKNYNRQLTLGQLYLRVGQRGPACTAFRAALAARPNHARTQKLIKLYCGS